MISHTGPLDVQQTALLELGKHLRETDYRFITPTPETHGRVLARGRPHADLTAIFGWSLSFDRAALPEPYVTLLADADCLERAEEGLFRSAVRFSSLGDLLLVHSSYPTSQPDAVFFGPDTYRFARAMKQILGSSPGFRPRVMVDIGAGTGAGGLVCAKLLPSLERMVLADVNDRALRFVEVNAALNGVATATALKSDVLAGFEGMADLVISNPPYLVDAGRRAYRHGGGDWGGELSVRILREGLDHLSEQGCLFLYTGTPVIGGRDMFREAVGDLLARRTRSFLYEEIDPDVFGEELERAPYDQADRIAAVMLSVNGKDLRR